MKLSLSDASALLSESPATPMHSGVLCLFALPDGAPGDYLLRRFEALKAAGSPHEPFNMALKQQRAPVDLPGWNELREHDYRQHFRHLALPWPGNAQQFAELVGDLHATPLNQSRPLWECVLIEGLANRQFAIYFKTHQALLETDAAMQSVTRWMSTAAGRSKASTPWMIAGRAAATPATRGPVELLFSAYGQALEQVRTVPGLTRALTRLATQAIKKNPQATLPYSAPNSLLNADVTSQRTLLLMQLQKSQLQQSARTLKVTAGQLLLAVLGGGLRRYLTEHKCLPAKPLIARTTISLKATGEAVDAVPVLVNLGTHIEDPLERVAVVADSIRDAQRSLASMSAAGVQRYASMLMWPYHLTKLAGVSRHVRPMFNLVLTDFGRQTKPLYVADAPLLAQFPVMTLSDGHVLQIGYRWYADSLDLCVTACPDRLPALELLEAGIHEALKGITSAI